MIPRTRSYKLVRAHGNTIEYVPILAVLILVLGMREPSTWVLWVIVGVTLGRYLIVAGMLLSSTLMQPHPLRFIGAAGTYSLGLVLCVALISSF